MRSHLSRHDDNPFPLLPFANEPLERDEKASMPRVIVVDDEVLIADTTAAILNNSGFIAEAVYDAREAIELAKRRCPEIVLSDVLMPGINGVDAAIAIQNACPDTRIVLFSGQAATTELLAEANAAGYEFELLPKPIHPSKLLRKLRQE